MPSLRRLSGHSVYSFAALLLFALCELADAAPAQFPVLGAGPGGKNGPAIAIPDTLRPWVGWVLYDKEETLCPFLHGESDDSSRQCIWPAELTLTLGDHGGRFVQRFRVYKKGWVALPGDGKVWPQSVLVNGKPAIVAAPGGADSDGDEDDKAHPQVLLLPGDHQVTGSFVWDEMPESLAVPSDTGLLSLSVRGIKLPLPSRDEEGRVWLQKEASEKEEEVLETTVHRQLTDDVPLQLTTRIELRVSGKSREVLLGRALPAGFVPLSLDAPLPARLEPDSHLRVQVRAGTWVLTLQARHEGPVTELKRPAPEGPWPDDEVWVFQARPSLRVVTIEGVPLIDPQQTTLPDAWKRLPCYPMHLTDTLKLVQQRRGDAEPAADQLVLHRNLWLDFNGSGYTASDHITGTLHRAWRLEVNPPMELGRVAVGGADQFITRGAGSNAGRAGVEVRQAQLDLSADSRIIPRHRGELPAVGWDADFHQVQPVTLHLPPGWKLFHATGADDVSGTWIGRWTLLDLFLLLITAMAIGRLYGVGWGVLTLVLLGLILPERDSPRWIFLAVLIAEALWRLLPAGRLRSLLQLVRGACLIVVALYSVSFAAHQLRAGLHPSQEHPDTFIGDQAVGDIDVPQSQSAGLGFNKDEAQNAPTTPPAIEQAPSGSVDSDSDGIPDEEDSRGAKGGASRPEPMKKKPKRFKAEIDEKEIKADKKVPDSLRKTGLLNILGGKQLNQSNFQWQQNVQQLDPNNVVQTGPGVPRWAWNRTILRFSGPVQRDQMLRLWLIGPNANLALALLRIALLSLLVLRLFGMWRKMQPPTITTVPVVGAALFALFLFVPSTARADEVPSQELLDELRDRLIKPAECHPNCASSSRLQLEVQPRFLRARLEVGAAATTGVPLPGGAQQWLPERVLLDGKPAPALLRTEDGKLWIQVSEGSHQILLEGPLPSRDTVQIALPLKPHRVEAKTSGWRLDGLHEDGEADDDLQLSRVEGNEADTPSGLQAGTLPPFVRIERDIQIGLKWEVQTKVVRVTPTGSAVVLEVPLLPGESVTTPEVRVQGQKALVNMAPNATELSWHSLLQERPELVLAAPNALPWVEVWRVDVSPTWHAEYSGIPVVQPLGNFSERRPEWRPWPGEQVKVALRRPDGVAGSTLTIDHSRLELRPGLRATDATLTFGLRSSRGGQHVLTLPEGAVLESLTIAGENQPLRQDGRRVTLPLAPGAREVNLRWREARGLSTIYRSSSVDLGIASVNAQVILNVSSDRWLLFCRGDGAGPFVLFWSYIPVLLLLAWALARVRLTPLHLHHYLLLGLGLSQVPLESAALFLGWLLALGFREKHPQIQRWWLFDLRQIALVVWTVVALGILLLAIREGLLGHPDMQISGNGSSRSELRFFLDHAAGPLPSAWIVSVPLLLYRLAMLLWALWMASALLRWLRWAFEAFSVDGLWRPRPPKPEKKESAQELAEDAATAKPHRDAKAVAPEEKVVAVAIVTESKPAIAEAATAAVDSSATTPVNKPKES